MGVFQSARYNGRNYIDYAVDENDSIDSFSEGMLKNNEVKQSLPMQILHQNGITIYRYNISGLMPLKFIYEEKINKKRFLGILEGMLESVCDADEYMLSTGIVCWDYDRIYVDERSNKAFLLYLPLELDDEIDVYGFFRELIFGARLDMSENSSYHSELINFMNMTNSGTFVVNELLTLVRRLQSEDKRTGFNSEYGNEPISARNVSSSEKEIVVKNAVRVDENDVAYIGASQETNVENRTRSSVDDSEKVLQQRANVSNQADETDKEKGESGGLLGVLRRNSPLLDKILEKNSSSKKSHPEKKAGNSFETDDDYWGSDEETGASVQKVKAKPDIKQGSAASIADSTNDTPKPATPVARNAKKNAEVITNANRETTPQAEVRSQLKTNHTVYIGRQDDGRRGGTIMMDSEIVSSKKVQPYLIRKKNNERIPLRMVSGRFRIGRDESRGLEFVIRDNMMIGRFHAQILQKESSYYLQDMNSTNGTRLNGKDCFSENEALLVNDDEIVFANETFIFKTE